MAGGLDYCKLGDVLGILYAGMGLAPGEAAPADDTRDARLEQLITATSRDFDYEVQGDTRNTPLFTPSYDVRLYSGKGGQLLSVDPFLAVTKLEVLTNPGVAIGSQTWNDTPPRSPPARSVCCHCAAIRSPRFSGRHRSMSIPSRSAT
jgi:hypothetical protein